MAFTLIADAPAPVTGPVIDVTKGGARAVVDALASGETAYLMRDPSAPPSDIAPGLWLQTSGTTGTPKWVRHDIDRLKAKIRPGEGEARWLLTFHPASFAGVQVILSAMAGGHTLVAPPIGSDVSDMANLALAHAVTHISGTPTFWRAFLMALGDRPLTLKAVTLGGEAADQGILDALHARFPQAHLRHIYATTEAGTVFTVSDGKAGFPSAWLGEQLSISPDDALQVDGRDTGDVVEVVGDRVMFKGRRDAMVNVGGIKVYPETVEAHLLELPCVQDARVTAKSSPITGHVLVAEVVGRTADAEAQVKAHVARLPRAQRPVSIRMVDHLEIGASGKKSRVS